MGYFAELGCGTGEMPVTESSIPLPDFLKEFGALPLVEPIRAHVHGFALRLDYARIK